MLEDLVRSISLVPMNDRWVWNLESTGDFSVSSIRRKIDEMYLPNSSESTRWVKCVPIKVNILAWKIRCDGLPTRINLSRRGIDIHAISCPICDCGVESSEHLFFSCKTIQEIGKKVVRWWNINYVEVNSYEEWKTWLTSCRMASKLKQIFEGVWYSLWWHVWNYRNKLLFDAKPPLKSTIFDNVIFSSFHWCKARSATKRSVEITFKRKQNPLNAKPKVISKLKSPTKHALKPEVKSKLKSPAKAKLSPPPRNPILRSAKHAPPLANPKPKAPKLKASDVTEFDQGDGSGSEEGDSSGSKEEGDEEEDEKEGDDEEDEKEGDDEEDEKEGEDEEDAIVKDEEYEEEEEEKVSEEEEEEEEEDIKDKRLGRKNERRILKPSFFKRQKPCEEDDKGGKKEGSKAVPSSFFHAIRDAKVSMKRFMEDIGFSAFHSVNIDTLPNRSKFVVKRLLIIKPYNFTLKQESSRREDDEFLTSYLFANVMVKKTHEGIGKSLVVRRIHEDTNIAELTGVIFISPCPAISHDPNTDSDIYNGSIAFLIVMSI
ncbi:RNA-directed DNA polymerase, eukaryota [Tanacetum coccineum]